MARPAKSAAERPTKEFREALRDPPPASTAAIRATMRGNSRTGTSPERDLRSALHRDGLRFRVDLPIRVPGRRPIRPDVVFTRRRVVVFVDGCFWHGCPEHGRPPRSNQSYWGAKLELNRRRDTEQTAALEAAGWTVIRIWEHDIARELADAVARVEAIVNSAPEPRDLTSARVRAWSEPARASTDRL